MLKHACMALLALAATACTTVPPPQRTGLPVELRLSRNFDERRPNFVILHYTSSGYAESALRTLTDPASRVSAHYLIARDGRIFQLVDELARAWHAGESYWGGNRDLNSASIGIELDNDGAGPYAETQVEALLALLADLKERYAIPAANFLGHSDVAPRRKVDPGRHFPWQRLATAGFGLWCNAPYPAPAPGADDAIGLAAFGYDTADLRAATAVFKTHFAPDADPQVMSYDDRALLYCLIGKKLQ